MPNVYYRGAVVPISIIFIAVRRSVKSLYSRHNPLFSDGEGLRRWGLVV